MNVSQVMEVLENKLFKHEYYELCDVFDRKFKNTSTDTYQLYSDNKDIYKSSIQVIHHINQDEFYECEKCDFQTLNSICSTANGEIYKSDFRLDRREMTLIKLVEQNEIAKQFDKLSKKLNTDSILDRNENDIKKRHIVKV